MMEKIVREDARLIILKALAAEVNGSLHSGLLQPHLELFGIYRTRAWLHEELTYLAQLGAVTITEAGTVRVATITGKGLDHVGRRTVIEGVKRPSPAES